VDGDIHFCAGTLDPLPASLTSDSFQRDWLRVYWEPRDPCRHYQCPALPSADISTWPGAADSARVLAAHPVRLQPRNHAREAPATIIGVLRAPTQCTAAHAQCAEWSRFLASYLQGQRHTTHIIRSAVIWAAMQTQTWIRGTYNQL
jgi:hypothetical protein